MCQICLYIHTYTVVLLLNYVSFLVDNWKVWKFSHWRLEGVVASQLLKCSQVIWLVLFFFDHCFTMLLMYLTSWIFFVKLYTSFKYTTRVHCAVLSYFFNRFCRVLLMTFHSWTDSYFLFLLFWVLWSFFTVGILSLFTHRLLTVFFGIFLFRNYFKKSAATSLQLTDHLPVIQLNPNNYFSAICFSKHVYKLLFK